MARKKSVDMTPWGTVDWAHASVCRDGKFFGPCEYCRRPAVMRHPGTGKPCHKVCDDAHIKAAMRV